MSRLFLASVYSMQSTKHEGRWLAGLDNEMKVNFLAMLAHELTIVGRNSYQPQTEELDNPRQLRRINEVQHRVLACLVQTLDNTCELSFQESIAAFVLKQSDPELRKFMQFAWQHTKKRFEA